MAVRGILHRPCGSSIPPEGLGCLCLGISPGNPDILEHPVIERDEPLALVVALIPVSKCTEESPGSMVSAFY